MRLGAGRRGSAVAAALPMPYPQIPVKLRRGQTSLWVGAPGTGKSQVLQNIAHRMRVPTLLWSADTDQSDVTIRSLALHTGYTVEQVEEYLHDEAWRPFLFERMGTKADHIDWVFDSPITGRHLGERLKAYAQVHGEYPHFTVLDNLSNALTGAKEEHIEVRDILTAVQQLARETKSHIAVAHHATGEYDSGNKPIPQSGGLNKPFKIPEVGLTLYRPDEDNRLAVCVVKQRGGKSDPAARHPVSLSIDFARASVLGFDTNLEK